MSNLDLLILVFNQFSSRRDLARTARTAEYLARTVEHRKTKVCTPDLTAENADSEAEYDEYDKVLNA